MDKNIYKMTNVEQSSEDIFEIRELTDEELTLICGGSQKESSAL